MPSDLTHITSEDPIDNLLSFLDTRISDLEFLLEGMPQKSTSFFGFSKTVNTPSSSRRSSALHSPNPASSSDQDDKHPGHSSNAATLGVTAKDIGLETNLTTLQHVRKAEKETYSVINSHETIKEVVGMIEELDLWRFLNLDNERDEHSTDSNDTRDSTDSTDLNDLNDSNDSNHQNISDSDSLLIKRERILSAADSFETVDKLLHSLQFHHAPSSSSSAHASLANLKSLSPLHAPISVSSAVAPLCTPAMHQTLALQAQHLAALGKEIDVLAGESVLVLDRLAALVIAENQTAGETMQALNDVKNKITIRNKLQLANNVMVRRWTKRSPMKEHHPIEPEFLES